MLDRIKGVAFSLSGLSISLGVLGFLSGLVQLFVDVNSTISIKWLLLCLLLAISGVFILLKVIFDLHLAKDAQSNTESPIRWIDNAKILVIRKNDHFVNQIIVGCYFVADEIERLAYVGVVHHVQEKVIQIRILRACLDATEMAKIPQSINQLLVRPVIPYSALDQLASPG